MKDEDRNRFPQKRNGVTHPQFGTGVVVIGSDGPGRSNLVSVQFDGLDQAVLVDERTLTSAPAHSVSPDPQTHRRSGYVGGNNYRRKDK